MTFGHAGPSFLLLLAMTAGQEEPRSPNPRDPSPPLVDDRSPEPATAPGSRPTPSQPTPHRNAATSGLPGKARSTKENSRETRIGQTCRSLRYAESNPDACGHTLAEDPKVQVPPTKAPANITAPPSAKPNGAPLPKNAPRHAEGAPLDKSSGDWALAGLVGGIVASLLAIAAGYWLRRRPAWPTSLVRDVELVGSELVRLEAAALSKGTIGPVATRWSVRDGRPVVSSGMKGALLNGVPLRRSGEAVSTGDVLRLGSSEFRVRIN